MFNYADALFETAFILPAIENDICWLDLWSHFAESSINNFINIPSLSVDDVRKHYVNVFKLRPLLFAKYYTTIVQKHIYNKIFTIEKMLKSYSVKLTY